MKDHILEFVSPGTCLTKSRGHLIVEIQGGKHSIPLDDIMGVLILGQNIMFSSNVVTSLLERGVILQFCDANYNPSGVLAPLHGHHLTRSRQLAQMGLSDIQKARFWQQIVIRKIANQAMVLEHLGLDPGLLVKFEKEVEIGDSSNHEAQAARVYWRRLFGPDFRRDRSQGGRNAFLNYGYSIVRSAVARYTVAAGLNPVFGVFHKNLENPLCLVDDLMEPFRPFVDLLCFDLEEFEEISPTQKRNLISVLEMTVLYRGEKKVLRSAIEELCQSFAKAVLAGDWRAFETRLRLG